MEKRIVNNAAYFALIEEQLLLGQQLCIPIRGNSMLPFLKEGDKVWIKQVAPDSMKVGDVLLCCWKDQVVLHRLVKKKKEEWLLAGDNNLGQLERVTPQQVLAKVMAREMEEGAQELPVRFRVVGLLWYYLRIPRILINKITR